MKTPFYLLRYRSLISINITTTTAKFSALRIVCGKTIFILVKLVTIVFSEATLMVYRNFFHTAQTSSLIAAEHEIVYFAESWTSGCTQLGCDSAGTFAQSKLYLINITMREEHCIKAFCSRQRLTKS